MADLNVANTIRDQIAAGVGVDGSKGFVCMMAWGSKNLTGSGEQTEKDRGFLSFQVKGSKFKGAVKVRLMWDDTYRVEFWTTRRPTFRMKSAIDGVYFDNLTTVIDRFVEVENG